AFGDPRQTARLIRRAKRRIRPLPVRLVLSGAKWSALAVGMLILVYMSYGVYFLMGSPNVERDYVAELNAPVLATPESDRAAPLYIEIAESLPMHVHPWHARLRGGENWEATVTYIAENPDVVTRIHEATDRPTLGKYLAHPDPHYQALLLDMYSPLLNEARRLYTVLVVDLRAAAASGDSARVMQNLRSMSVLPSHLAEGPFLISGVIAAHTAKEWAQEMVDLLALSPGVFSDEDLVSIDAMAHSLHDRSGFVDYSSERMTIDDVIQHAFTDDGKGGGRLTRQGIEILDSLYADRSGVVIPRWRYDAGVALVGPAYNIMHAGRRETREMIDRLFSSFEEELAKPLWDRDFQKFIDLSAMLERDPSTERRYAVVLMMMPALTRASAHDAIAIHRIKASRVAIALERFRRAEGRWPHALEELTPGYIESIPKDAFDGCVLKYRVRDGEPILYSVGADRVDRAGTPTVTAKGAVDPELAGQWISRSHLRTLNERISDPAQRAPWRNADWVLFSPAIARLVDEQARTKVNDED
ncbi:MAG: hypothetical protein EA379_12590, partial [Phycisphaerales bacterium]